MRSTGNYMYKTKDEMIKKSVVSRPLCASMAFVLLLVGLQAANAKEFATGDDWTVRWDNTVKFNYALRAPHDRWRNNFRVCIWLMCSNDYIWPTPACHYPVARQTAAKLKAAIHRESFLTV